MAKIMLNGVDYSAPVASGVSGVKGNAESSYRSGNVNITPEDIGAYPYAYGESAFAKANAAYNKAIYTYTNAEVTELGYASSSSGYGVAIGGKSIAGTYATAVGYGSTAYDVYSVAVGYYATSPGGNGAIAIGEHSNASYSKSIAFGAETAGGGNCSTAIGYGAIVTESNSMQLGSGSSLSKLSSRVSLTVTSDERDKTDIVDLEDGAIKFLNKIRTIRYVLNHRELYIDEDSLTEKDKEDRVKYGLCRYNKEAHAKGTKKGKRIRVGVSAQNTIEALKEVYGNSNYANIIDDNFFDLSPDEIPKDVENKLSANYEAFIPFLIKAIQEIDARLTKLEKGD